MKTQENIWYAFKGVRYTGKMPYFFDSDNFDWCKLLNANFAAINSEIQSYLTGNLNSLEPYFNQTLVEGAMQWKTSNFIFWSERNEKNCEKIPNTISIFSQINGLISLGISVLESGVIVKPHQGDTNGIIRCHYALSIPDSLPNCGIKVGSEEKSWREGETILFCDAHEHTAWNKSNKPRFVLIFDIIHPLFSHFKNEICANVLSALELQKKENKKPFLKNAPGPVRAILRKRLFNKIIKRLN